VTTLSQKDFSIQMADPHWRATRLEDPTAQVLLAQQTLSRSFRVEEFFWPGIPKWIIENRMQTEIPNDIRHSKQLEVPLPEFVLAEDENSFGFRADERGCMMCRP
jgi:hypothetical protein